eukprot:126816-Rhodomonas_salina.1
MSGTEIGSPTPCPELRSYITSGTEITSPTESSGRGLGRVRRTEPLPHQPMRLLEHSDAPVETQMRLLGHPDAPVETLMHRLRPGDAPVETPSHLLRFAYRNVDLTSPGGAPQLSPAASGPPPPPHYYHHHHHHHPHHHHSPPASSLPPPLPAHAHHSLQVP